MLVASRTYALNASRSTKGPDTQTRAIDLSARGGSCQWHRAVDTEAGMLSGISRKHSIRSNPYWFTEFCNSQCLSHFAAPFIVVRAETSVAESCIAFDGQLPRRKVHAKTQARWFQMNTAAGTDKEDGPSPPYYPRDSAQGNRRTLHPCTQSHTRLFTVRQVDACE